jgi:hypothetical protein
LQVYDTSTNTWSYLAAAPTARGYAAVAVVNNKLLVIGGTNGSSYYQTVEEYDPATNTWKRKADTAGLRGYMGGAEVLNGRVYLSARDYAAMEMFDPATNLWLMTDQMPGRYSYGDIAAVNGKIYALGSDNGGSTMHFISGTLSGSDGTIAKYPYRPSVVADPNNNVFVYWIDGNYYSVPDGQTSSVPTGATTLYAKKINASTGVYSTATGLTQAGRYAVSQIGNTAHLVYQSYAGNQYSYMASQDGGATWGQPVDVPVAGTATVYDSFNLAGAADGNAHFTGVIYEGGTYKLVYKNLVGTARLQTETVSTTGSYFCYYGAGVDNQNQVVVTFVKNYSLYLTKRLADSTWTDPVISLPASQSVSTPYSAAIDASANKLHLVYNAPVAGHAEIFYNAADLSGDFQAPVATLTGPASGEVVAGGSTRALSWAVTDDKGVTSVLLKYTTDGGVTFTPITSGLSSTGSYSWTVPNIGTAAMQVYLVATDTASKQTNAISNTFTVTFIPTYSLTVSRTGNGSGSVTSNPSGINCGAGCSAGYAANSGVSLSAMPADGSRFTGWTGACQGTGSCNVLLDTDKGVGAGFELVPIDGSCGSSNGKALTVAPITNLCVTGTPSAVVGSGPWSWICQGIGGGGSVMCSATRSSLLTLVFAGTGGGSVSGDVACASGQSCPAVSLAYGSTATLIASPDAISTFAGWSGDCAGSGTCSASMTANRSVTVSFAAAPKAMIGAAGFDSLLLAYGSAGADAEIWVLETVLAGDVNLDQERAITLKGGFTADYKARTGLPTVLNGTLAVRKGSLKVDGVAVK